MKLTLFIDMLDQVSLCNTFPVLSFWQNDTNVTFFCVQSVLYRDDALFISLKVNMSPVFRWNMLPEFEM